MAFRVAYLINQYPKVSHSFIRREILALEQQGLDVQRIALRGWDAELEDEEDKVEQRRTRYVLQQGMAALLLATAKVLVTAPGRFFSALRLAVGMGIRSERPLPYHLIYLAEACQILPWLKSFGASHIHAHFGTNSAEVAMLAHRLGGPPYSFTVHGPDEFDKPEFLSLGAKIREARFVVAVSSFGQSQLYRWTNYTDWRKIHVIHCGLPQEFWSAPSMTIPDSPRLLCVGRLSEQKGQILLIEAVKKLVAEGITVELVLAGDGPMRQSIESLVKQYHLSEFVRITGWIAGAKVRQELSAARAMVLPSFAEGLPVVIMESLALSRPVISTYIAGIPELVEDRVNGWLIPAGSLECLVQAMREALLAPISYLEQMGERGREKVFERHHIAHEATKLSKLFQEM